jgi:hypothetical protein
MFIYNIFIINYKKFFSIFIKKLINVNIILKNNNIMSSEIYTFNNYTFNLELESNQINIKLIDNTILEMYEGFVKEKNIYIKLDKFYSMIVKSLNKEPNYNMTISDTNSHIICIIISFNNEVIDFEKKIFLDKINSYKIKELLLTEKIKQLKEQNNRLDQEKAELSKELDRITQQIKTTAEIEFKNKMLPKKTSQINNDENNCSYFS